MKKILIVSPSFPPVNTADMQRVRMSLPYFREFGWEPTVIAVMPEYVEAPVESNLLLNLPKDIEIHRVKAFSTGLTRKFGLGNLGFRSLLQILRKCIELFKEEQYHLIYFSTTVFPVMVLGRILKKLYNVPFVIDMQDPWRPDHYLDKPKNERPPKFEFAYRINAFLEKATVPYTDGIIAVSEGYIKTLKERYPAIKNIISDTITFGAAEADFEILSQISTRNSYFAENQERVNIIYVGRGGYDLHYSLKVIFQAISKGLKDEYELFRKVRLYFIGTSYAKNGTGTKTIEPLAKDYNLGGVVTEVTDRVPYFEALRLLMDADLLFIPGSTEANYTASKLYPYILAKKNILAIFHEESSVVDILNKTNAGEVVKYNLVNDNQDELIEQALFYLKSMLRDKSNNRKVNWEAFGFYTAKQMTKRQVQLFNEITGNITKGE